LPDAERVVGVEARALAVAALRVDEHRVERVRLDLPLPPVAARASHAISRIAPLEHEALGALLAALRAGDRERLPRGCAHERRDMEARAAGNGVHDLSQPFAALVQGSRAPVLATHFEQVEREEDDGG